MSCLSAQLVICYSLSEEDEQRLVADIDKSPDSSLLIVLRNSKCGSQLLSSVEQDTQLEVFDIMDEDKISGFFKAKRKLDDVMANNVNLVSLENDRYYFVLLCRTFFTPVITWSCNNVDVADISNQLSFKNEESAIIEEVKSFLSRTEGFGEVETIKSDLIPGDIFYHGFNKRTGGLSGIPGMKSLNMSYSTAKRDPQCVIEEHRRRLAQKAGFDKDGLHIARTVHGNNVHLIGCDIPEGGYDGVITNQKGVTCGAPGADCIMMLFADPVKKACGAIHSGWMGTLAQICVETVRKMTDKFNSKPEDIRVVMGPSICKLCFEFGEEDSKKFADIDPACVVRVPGRDKPSIDLKLANRILLEREGIRPGNIDDTTVSFCTTENPDAFFSYRRDGKPFGNQIGFIGIN